MNFAWNARLQRSIQESFTCRKSTTWDRRLYFPSEGRHAEEFFALKNPTASAGSEPANLGTKGRHATSRPPKPLWRLSTLFEFCMTHGLTLNVSEEMTEILHGNLTFQPYNCTLHINSFSMTKMVGWGRSSFDWLTHKISGAGPTQIQDNHKKDHSKVRDSCRRMWCWANRRQWTLLFSRHIQLCSNSKHRTLHTKVTNVFFMFCWPYISV